MDDVSMGSYIKTGMQKIKIVLIGDQGVGKTSIMSRFTNDKFDPTHIVINYYKSLQLELILHRNL